MAKILSRWQEQAIRTARKERRVLLLSGPRQCGKTTLVKHIAGKSVEYRTLDEQTLREAAASDPAGFVTHDKGMLIIDEIQHVPALLPAIKKAADDNTKPGRFLLTGSANIQTLPSVSESLAGRVAHIRLRTLTEGEVLQARPRFLARAFQQQFNTRRPHYNKDRILDTAFRGGFPEILKADPRARRRWHRDYIRALLERDLQDIVQIRRQEAMHELVGIVAAWSSRFMDVSAIGAGLGIQRPTLESYLNALETLYVIERVRPWTKTDYARVGKQKKLFMTDSGLMASLLRWNIDQVKNNADQSGKLLETFIFNELAAQVEAGDGEYTLYHYRDREQREIDFLIEREDGAILGIEVKAAATARKTDFKHLRWFQENLAGSRSFTGIVLYTGENAASFGENLWAVPAGAMWG